MQYRAGAAVDALLKFVATLQACSEIVFSFSPPNDELDGDDLSAAINGASRTAALGEPWKSRLRSSELVDRLTQFGFGEIYHLSPELAQQRYLANQHDVPTPPRWEQLIAAIV
jgi:O-methyltransferase involved in polyketide biosynthesis